MADLTRDDIVKLAQLARIDIAADEVAEYLAELQEILHYVEQLNTVDVSGLKPTSQVTGLTNVMRTDEVIDYGYLPADLLKQVPRREQDHIQVNRMIT